MASTTKRRAGGTYKRTRALATAGMDPDRTFEGPAVVGILATAVSVVLVWELLPGDGAIGQLLSMAVAPLVGVLLGALLASWSLTEATVRERVFLCLFSALLGLAGAAFIELWWLHAACGGEACDVPVRRTQALVLALPFCVPSWLAGALVPTAVESRRDPAGFPYWRSLMVVLGGLGFVLLVLAAFGGALVAVGRVAVLSQQSALLAGLALLPAVLALGSLPSLHRLRRAARPPAVPPS